MESSVEKGLPTSSSSPEESRMTMTTMVTGRVRGQRLKDKLKNKLCKKPSRVLIVVASIIGVAALSFVVYYTGMSVDVETYTQPQKWDGKHLGFDPSPTTLPQVPTTKRKMNSHILKGTGSTVRVPTEERFGVAASRFPSQKASTIGEPTTSTSPPEPSPSQPAKDLSDFHVRPKRPTLTRATSTTLTETTTMATTLFVTGDSTEYNIAGITVD